MRPPSIGGREIVVDLMKTLSADLVRGAEIRMYERTS